MRSTTEIFVAVMENQPATEEELRLGGLVLMYCLQRLNRELRSLYQAFETGGANKLVLRLKLSERVISELFTARKADPAVFLGPTNTPGNPDHDRFLAQSKRMFEKAVGYSIDELPNAPQTHVALLLDHEEHAAVVTALRMFVKMTTGEGPYLDAVKRVVDRLGDPIDARR